MTKKSLTLLFVLVLSIMLVFAFSACGGNDTPVDTGSDTGSQGTTPSPDDDKGTDDGNGGNGGTPDGGETPNPDDSQGGEKPDGGNDNDETSIGELEFTLDVETNTYTVTDIGSCTDTEIVIPTTYKNLPVTSIGDYAFYDCTSLTSVTIGNSVTSIGDYAFYGCTSLTSITIPDSVASIGSRAFIDCTSLKEVHISDIASWCNISFSNYASNPLYCAHNLYINNEFVTELVIPNTATKINAYAFYNCTSLTSITIPDSVTSIGECAFSGCTSLTSVTIGEGVTSIGDCAFYDCDSLTSVTIGNSVTSIGIGAFNSCTSLESVTIPNSVTSIGERAFQYCYKLVEVYNLSSLTITAGSSSNGYVGYYAKVIHTSLEEKSILETVNDYIFMTLQGKYYLIGYVGNDKELTLPESYNGNNYEIYQYAFYERDDITKVTIGDSVTSIGDYAFYGCTSLTSITIPDSVASIGSRAFIDCTSLKEVHISDIASWCNISFSNYASNPLYCAHNLYINNEFVTELVIPNTATKINAYAFYYCTSLTSVTIGDSVTSIGGSAFEVCTSLTSITIPDSVTSIGKSAFCNCDSLTSITIPDSVTSIGYDAFRNCTSLTSITIPDSVTSIGSSAFYGCDSLTSVTIGNSVTSIGSDAFNDCTSLVEINFNATAMDDLSYCNYVFSYAGKDGNGIKVIIGKNVTKIPDYLFCPYYGYSSYSPKITSVVFEEGSVCEIIGNYAFRGCTSLTSVTIPNSVTSIGSNAFSGTSLTSVTIGNSVASIGSRAFYDCTNLTEINFNATAMDDLGNSNYVFYNAGKDGNGIKVTIGANVTKIPAYLFTAAKITSVVFEKGSVCESIGDYAFEVCTSLTSITIPNSVTSIGNSAFSYCTSLTSITFENTSGWYVTKSQGATSGTNVDVTNATTNATYLKSTYKNYYWYRKAE